MDENRPMTKKELKAARRSEKKDYYKDEKKQNTLKWVIIGLSSIIFLGFFGFLIFLAKQNNTTTSEPVAISENTGWVKGAEDASVTLVEYGDFQCPACRAYHPVVKELLAGYEDGELKLIFKHFPLTSIHPNAMAAAKAAEAAGAQGKFFEYHDILYDMQDVWSGMTAIDADAKFIEYGEELELDIDQFNADRNNPETEKIIRASIDEGAAAGAAGTPSFFVNGKKIVNPQSVEEFRKIIDEELK